MYDFSCNGKINFVFVYDGILKALRSKSKADFVPGVKTTTASIDGFKPVIHYLLGLGFSLLHSLQVSVILAH